MTRVTNRTRATLENMRLPDLQQRFEEVTGRSTRSPNKTFLVRSIVEALEAAPAEPEGTSAPSAPTDAAAAFEEEPVSSAEPVADTSTSGELEDSGSGESDVETSVHSDAHRAATVESEAEAAVGEHALDEAIASDAAPPHAADCEPTAMPASLDAVPETLDREQVALECDEPPSDSDDAGPPAQDARTTPSRRPARGELTGLTVEELQARYLGVVGRPTGSSDRQYLVWKIREAMKGKVPTGPRTSGRRASQGDDMMVLPLRLPASTVDAMDHAWHALGIRTRMDFFRDAIRLHLDRLGAREAASLFAQPEAELAQEAP
jgi:hypothetical protein